MLVAILGDFHIGMKNDNRAYMLYQNRFLNDIFFPELEKRGIKKVIQVGDLGDRRKYSNHETIHNFKINWFDIMKEKDIEMDVFPGNHDVALKNSNKINFLNLFLNEYENINQIHKPTEIVYGSTKFLMIPWINEENYNETMQAVENSDANVVIGHFEFAGFDIGHGMMHQHGMSHKIFSKFEKVYSGHYHLSSKKDNVLYLGTPFEVSWAEAGTSKGFYIFDTETRELEFISNPYTMHEKIFYDDTNAEFVTFFKNINYSSLEGKSIKVFVQKKSNNDMFEEFIENLYKINLTEFQIIEDVSSFHETQVTTTIDATTSTGDLINQYIDNVETEMDKPRLKAMTHRLYLEALMENKE